MRSDSGSAMNRNTSWIERLRSQSSPTELESSSERTISQSLEAVTFILVRAKCPIEHRAYIDAVLGAADGRDDWFQASDLEIGKRMLGAETYVTSSAGLKKRVQRHRKSLTEWQEREGYGFIEADPGGKRDGAYHKTQYRVPILAAAADVLRKAQLDHHWTSRPAKALSNAAKTVLPSLKSHGFQKRDRFNRPRRDDAAIIGRNAKTIQTLFIKTFEIIRRNGGNPEAFFRSTMQTAQNMLEAPTVKSNSDAQRESSEPHQSTVGKRPIWTNPSRLGWDSRGNTKAPPTSKERYNAANFRSTLFDDS